MKAIKCNKAYLGTKEVTQGSISAGDSSIGLLYTSIFRKLGDYQTGDAVVWDTWKELFKVTPPENINQLDTERYIPTGVIAIPSSHDVYGTGECGVVALMSASLTTPDTGQTSNAGIAWGAYGTDYPELNNFNVGVYSKKNKVDAGVALGTTSTVYLPSDNFSASQCSTDPKAYYKWDDGDPYAPSPYLEDGSRNSAYYQTNAPSSTANALSDFAGKANTEFLCSKATSQENWRTDGTITNNTSSSASTAAGYHPAACCCWRYHTVGTSHGDWYLPACGELGYCCVRYKLINETIVALQAWSGKTYCSLTTGNFWSSSEYSSSYARGVGFSVGRVDSGTRGYSFCVRPFTRLK